MDYRTLGLGGDVFSSDKRSAGADREWSRLEPITALMFWARSKPSNISIEDGPGRTRHVRQVSQKASQARRRVPVPLWRHLQ